MYIICDINIEYLGFNRIINLFNMHLVIRCFLLYNYFVVIMKVFLSIVLDYNGDIRENLCEADSLIDMDRFLNKSRNSSEIREEYRDIIQEFLLDNRKYLEKLDKRSIEEGRKPRKYLGRITLCFYGKGHILRFIPILFNNELLMNEGSCYRRMRESLLDDKVLKKVYEEKRYLLSQFEIDTLHNYFNKHLDKDKKYFIDEFIHRIKLMNKDFRYLYFRSLAHTLSLVNKIVVRTKYGNISNISVLENKTVLVRDRIVNDCLDDYFINLVDKGDYEELFSLYSLDDILKYSSDIDNPLGLRR